MRTISHGSAPGTELRDPTTESLKLAAYLTDAHPETLLEALGFISQLPGWADKLARGGGGGPATASPSQTDWRSQRVFKFPHIEASGQSVNDLHIEFNVVVTVVTDGNGNAGGFQSISGNGSKEITLSDPITGDSIPKNDEPIPKFRTSETGEIKVVKWHWTYNGDAVSPDGAVDDKGRPKA